VLVVLYLLSCLLVAYFGRDRVLGFWGSLILGVVFTPFLVAVMLLLGGPSRRHRTHGCNVTR
jgi:hypothetical protein